MAQAPLKKPSTSLKPSSKPARPTGITKKYQSVKPSRNPKLIKAAKINKKFTSGLTAQTEQMLGQRAGHLEMIGKGKKEKGVGVTSGHGKKGGEKRAAPMKKKNGS